MSYQKHNWITREIIRRQLLQNIEDGIYNEQERAIAAEVELGAALSTETSRAVTKENQLNSAVTDLSNSLTSETSRATTKESALETAIGDEITRATTAEGQLSSSITSLSQTVNSEISRATQAESDLHDYVDQKVTGLYKPSGSVYFADLPGLAASRVGNVYDIIDAFTTTSDFREGAGKSYGPGTNVVIIDNGGSLKYDCLPGSTVVGVKGDAEGSYRIGQVNITKANIGLGNVGNFKAVSTEASQGLTDTEKTNARTNIGVGNATLTIQKNGTTVKTFTSNATSDVTCDITMTKSDVGLGNVGNFKAVSTVASQGLTDTEKANARTNIGAGTGSVTGVKGNSESTYRTGNVNITAANIGLGNVGNYKAVSTVANQGLSDTEKANARANIGAGSATGGTVTKVSTGAGLTGGDITTSGTIKAKLKSETQSSLTAAARGSTSDREYPIGLDADGNLSVNVPWTNTTYTPQKLGFGYATCSTAAATTAKVATLTDYVLVKNGYVSVKFTNSVPASATLNVNSKGAKAIYYHGAAITANIIGAGDLATFVYDGTNYNLVGVDNVSSQIQTLTNQVGNNTSQYSLVQLRQYYDDLIMHSLAYEEPVGAATRAYKVGDIVFKGFEGTSESPNWSLVKVTSSIPQGGTFTIGSNCKAINLQMIPTGYSLVSTGYNNVNIYHKETIGGVHQILIQGAIGNPFQANSQSIIGLKSVADAIKLPNYDGVVEFNANRTCKLYYDDTYLYLSPSVDLSAGHQLQIRFVWIEENIGG